MKAMLKFRNHLSVVAIRNECSNGDSFSFTQVEKKKREKEIELDFKTGFE